MFAKAQIRLQVNKIALTAKLILRHIKMHIGNLFKYSILQLPNPSSSTHNPATNRSEAGQNRTFLRSSQKLWKSWWEGGRKNDGDFAPYLNIITTGFQLEPFHHTSAANMVTWLHYSIQTRILRTLCYLRLKKNKNPVRERPHTVASVHY